MVDARKDLEQRLECVRAAMIERKLGSLIAYSSGQHSALRMDQVFYLTDFRPIGPSVLLVPVEGGMTLLVSPPWDAARAREAVGSFSVVPIEARQLPAAVAEHAAGMVEPLALSGRDVIPVGVAQSLFGSLGGEPADAEDLIRSLGKNRTPLELERVTRAAELADEGFRVLCEVARVGMREYELAAEVEAAMQAAGSEDNFGLLGAGAHNIAIRPPTDRRLEPGDVIIGEITPCYQGHLAQLCRTLILGEPTALQREKYDLLLEAQAAGLAAAKPGRPSADIARAVNAVLSAAGYAEYCRQPYMRTRGHGLGFSGVVPYDLTEDSSPVLEEGMTFVIHPNQYIPETGYMMLGDHVVIERSGARRLSQTALQLFSKAI